MTTATRPSLAATERAITGKAVAHIRHEGGLPGVVFGRGIDSKPVTIDAHEFDQLRRHTGPNTLIDLSVDGERALPVLVHGVQVHPLSRRPVHVDLFLVRMTEELIVDVPLVPSGESLAVTQHGGTLLQLVESVKVKALPDHLPQSIELPIGSLVDFDATIRLSELTIPSDVTLLNDLEEVVAKVAPPRIEVEPVAPEALEGEAEGEAAEETESTESTEGESES
jgi:large subunit ribosomal protein L25